MSIIEDNSSKTAFNSPKPIGEEFGHGEIIVEKINAQNTSKKFSSFISKGSQEVNIDGTTFTKSAKGNIIISENEIICGNVKYPFDKIVGIVRSANNLMKSVDVTLETMIENKTITITGIAKGSGMIHPDMATTLGFVFTDAKISGKILKQLLKK